MLYESDVNKIISEWKSIADRPGINQQYKDALRDCMYDLNCLVDRQAEEEALANESFEKKMKEEWDCWNEYFTSVTDGVS